MKTKYLWLALCVIVALLLTSAAKVPEGARTTGSSSFDAANANVLAAARQELLAAAKAHRVSIEIEHMIYASDHATTTVHAPITGFEKYKDADFAAGALVQVVVIRSAKKLSIPNGSYLIKAQVEPHATSGKAIFIDRNGSVVAQHPLSVRTLAQTAEAFPRAFPNPLPHPSGIPDITSHEEICYLSVDEHGTETWVCHHYVDCSGVSGTLIYELD